MITKELWQYFWYKKVVYSHPFDRDFVWVLRKDFEVVQSNFVKEFNIRHIGKSLRSKAYFWHIHAVDEGEYFMVHKDFGNLARFFPLGILHLFLDVLPYIACSWIKRRSISDLCARPEIK